MSTWHFRYHSHCHASPSWNRQCCNGGELSQTETKSQVCESDVNSSRIRISHSRVMKVGMKCWQRKMKIKWSRKQKIIHEMLDSIQRRAGEKKACYGRNNIISSGVLWLRQSAASVPPVFGIPLLVVQSGVAFQHGTSFSFCTAQTEINCTV